MALAFFGCGLLGTIWAKFPESTMVMGIISMVIGVVCFYQAITKLGFDPLKKLLQK